MDTRKDNLLALIVEGYAKTVAPIGSQYIAASGALDCSPATIRNEMAELVNLGLIFQPHTSAGRIPTDKGYRYYVDRFVKAKDLKKIDKEFLSKLITTKTPASIKELAKGVAQLSGQGIIIGFSTNETYYTGLKPFCI